MKIVILSHAFEYTGAPLACLSLAIAAKRLGHDVAVFSPFGGPVVNDLNARGIPAIKVVDLSCDLYIASTVLMLPAAHRLRDLGKNVVPIIHEMMDYSSFAAQPSELLQPKDWSLDKFGFCICVSSAQRDAFRLAFPMARLCLLEYCCAADQLGEEEVDYSPGQYFVYPGNFEPRKGHETLLRKLMNSQQARPEKIILLGASRESLNNQAMPCEIRSLLYATDFVAPSVAVNIVRRSLGLISFSLSETKGLSVLDALWYGKRVLLSPIPAFRTFSWSPLVRYSDPENPDDPTDLDQFVADMQAPPAEGDLRENDRVIRGVHSSASYEARVDTLLGLLAPRRG